MDIEKIKKVSEDGKVTYITSPSNSVASKVVTNWLHNETTNNDDDEFNPARLTILEEWLTNNNIELPWIVFINSEETELETKQFIEYLKTLKTVT
jgi:hypothetical protein